MPSSRHYERLGERTAIEDVVIVAHPLEFVSGNASFDVESPRTIILKEGPVAMMESTELIRK